MKFKKSKRTIKYIVIHCTATREGYPVTAEDIDRWHKAQGWDGIGYNYVIGLDGTLQEGRDVDKIPAHVKGYNRNSLEVVYVGGLDQDMKPKDTRTIEQKSMLWMLLDMLKKCIQTPQFKDTEISLECEKNTHVLTLKKNMMQLKFANDTLITYSAFWRLEKAIYHPSFSRQNSNEKFVSMDKKSGPFGFADYN